MVSYDGLKQILREKWMTKTDLCTALGISSRTVAKIGKGERLSERTIRRIAGYLECDPERLCREISGNPVLQILRRFPV